jgi:hypothetical protein
MKRFASIARLPAAALQLSMSPSGLATQHPFRVASTSRLRAEMLLEARPRLRVLAVLTTRLRTHLVQIPGLDSFENT